MTDSTFQASSSALSRDLGLEKIMGPQPAGERLPTVIHTPDQRLGVKRGVVECLVGLGAILTVQGQFEQAAQNYSAANAHFLSLGTAMWPADRVELQHCLVNIQALLDEGALILAQKAGQALSLDEALRRARHLLE